MSEVNKLCDESIKNVIDGYKNQIIKLNNENNQLIKYIENQNATIVLIKEENNKLKLRIQKYRDSIIEVTTGFIRAYLLDETNNRAERI
jgi:hypothetical protein